ncbi:hypothetical protein N9Z52_02175 [Akkermansiaceae bacterium]|nr:hypothetical protein [Akkermansiaceae bacterium]
MDSDNPPTLQHGIPDPESYLPETPDWFLWFLISGVILTILAIWWLIRLLFAEPKKTKPISNLDFFTPAMSVLNSLESQADERLISEIAAEASLAIRTYLAGAQAEPALYEILRKSSGEPEVQLRGAAALKAKEVNAAQVMVSLTHSKDYAAANAVIMAV